MACKDCGNPHLDDAERARRPSDLCTDCRNFLDATEAVRVRVADALKLSQVGHHEKALGQLDDIIKQGTRSCNPDWFANDVRGYMCIVLENAGQMEKALSLYELRRRTGFRTSSDYLGNQSGIASALRSLKNSAGALRELDKGIAAIDEETMEWALPFLVFYAQLSQELGIEVSERFEPLIREVARIEGREYLDEFRDSEGRLSLIFEIQEARSAET